MRDSPNVYEKWKIKFDSFGTTMVYFEKKLEMARHTIRNVLFEKRLWMDAFTVA